MHSSSSTLSPLTLSFNSSNSLLGNSFEIFPSGHSFIDKISSQQSTNTSAATMTTYTVSSSSLKRDLGGILDNSIGQDYAKFKKVTASVSRQVQGIAMPTVDMENDVSKNADDYYDRSVLDHMRLIGDAYENQDESSNATSYNSNVDHNIEEITSDGHRQQTLKHEGKRQQPASVSAIDRGFGGVSVAVVDSLAGKSTNTKSGSRRELYQTSFSNSEMIRGASYLVEEHQSQVAEVGLPGLQQQCKPDTEKRATRSEETQDQHCDLLPRRHGDKPEIGQLPAQRVEAHVKVGYPPLLFSHSLI